MNNQSKIELVYEFLREGTIFKLVDDKIKVLTKKNIAPILKDKLTKFLFEEKAFLRALLMQNKQDISSDSLVLSMQIDESKLSFAQERLWFIDKYELGTSVYNIPMCYELADNINLAFLYESIKEVVDRHEILRSIIKEDSEGNGYQLTLNKPISIPQENVKGTEKLHHLLSKEAHYLFKLDQEYPIKFLLIYNQESKKYYLSIIVHHIAFDGWSTDLFLRDLKAFYNNKINKTESLPLLPIQYKDFALWQRCYLSGERLKRELNYWKSQFEDYQPLNFITDYTRPKQFDYQGDDVAFTIDSEVSRNLRMLAKNCGVSLYSLLLTAYFLMLKAFSGQNDLILGSLASNRHISEIENLIGFFVNSLPLRSKIIDQETLQSLIKRVSQTVIEAQLHQDLPFEKLVEELQLPKDTSRHPLFQILFTVQNFGTHADSEFLLPYLAGDSTRQAKFDLSTYIDDSKESLRGWFNFATSLYKRETIERFIETYLHILSQFADSLHNNKFVQIQVSDLTYLNEKTYKTVVYDWNQTEKTYAKNETIQTLFESQVIKTPNNIAVIYEDNELTYEELNELSNRLAHHLRDYYQVKAGDLVGICLDRSEKILVAILGILKAGGAYVPIDPNYPVNRVAYILNDTNAKLILTEEKHEAQLSEVLMQNNLASSLFCIGATKATALLKQASSLNPVRTSTSQDLAYVIYTSGTTGNPKGVMIEQKNAVNFLLTLDLGEVGTWLAVTNITFDISVLELLGTLIKGFKVVIAPAKNMHQKSTSLNTKKLDFSLMYFGNYDTNKPTQKAAYDLLMSGAKFADNHQFSAIWTPERHFASFGGLYPNPVVTGAAVASVTQNIHIRSGSCVLPLHNPIRIAEDWALLDNLSNGRVGMAFATGWHENDFVLAPENYKNRKEILFSGIETIKKLWAGEEIEVTGVQARKSSVAIYPRPIQKALPLWITTGGNPESFRQAGLQGAKVLTHLLGQTIDELAEKIKIYYEAYNSAGHAKEQAGVTLMIHTFLSHDEEFALQQIKKPFKKYLKGALDLLAKQMGQEDIHELTNEEREALLEQGFLKYYKENGLFGTPQSCLSLIKKLQAIGISELACLIDFGVDEKIVLESLPYLNELRKLSSTSVNEKSLSEAELIKKYQVTHLQCTPSFAQVFFEENENNFSSLKNILLGGEALPKDLVDKIKKISKAQIYNMYGPTEATIWATSDLVEENKITIGYALANVKTYILNSSLSPCGVGMVGELYLGGEGIARGYLNQNQLTDEKFIYKNFTPEGRKERLYKTGDSCRYLENRKIEFIGRIDNQIKLRGHRIELEEITKQVLQFNGINQAITLTREQNSIQILVTYYVAAKQLDEAELISFLKKSLPEYMLPNVFIPLEYFPLTANGKLDIQALPIKQFSEVNKYIAPRNDLEKQLVEVYAELLMIPAEKIGVTDNFFHLGGNSLSVIRLVRKLNNLLGVDLPIAAVFENLTISDLAQGLQKNYKTEKRGEEIEF